MSTRCSITPRHPYTKALLGCVAGIEDDRSVPLEPIAGARAGSAKSSPRLPLRAALQHGAGHLLGQDQPLALFRIDHAVACILAQAEAAHA